MAVQRESNRSTPSPAGASVSASSTTAGHSKPLVTSSSANASERIARLVAGLQQERAMSQFEAAVLAEMCEQQADSVLAVVSDPQRSLAAKKQYLLDLLSGTPSLTITTSATTVIASSGRACSVQTSRTPLEQPTPRRLTDHAGDRQQQLPSRPEDLHVELVFKKVLAIARSVFSPQTQTQLTKLANDYRSKHSQPQSASPLTDIRFTSVMELLAILEKLLTKHALPEDQSVRVIELVLTENRILLSALQAFKQDGGSLSELEGTMTRIASLNSASTSVIGERAGITKVASPRSKSPRRRAKDGEASTSLLSPRQSRNQTPSARKSKALESVANDHSTPVSSNNVMLTLHRKRMLTSLEYDILSALVQQDDSQVLAHLSDYDQQQISLLALRDALVSIVDEITTELGDEEKVAFARGMTDAALEEQRQYEAGSMTQWPQNIAQMVYGWRRDGALTADHVQVLEQMIAQRHHLLESAFEVFAGDGDESELLDTLQRIAKLQTRVLQMADQERSQEQQAFNKIVDTQCHALGMSDKLLVKQLFARRSELVIAAWQVFEEEHDADELGDTLLRVARFTTRNDSKLRLVEVVGEMMKRHMIHSHEADGLIRLFEQKNEAMLAANEAFEADSDVKELVETLLLVVKHANFGSPPICSPRGTGQDLDYEDGHVSSAADDEVTKVSRLIHQIASKGRFVLWQKELLLSLVAARDDRVLGAVDLYNEDRNARELVDTLQRLADLVAWTRGKQQLVDEWITPLTASGQISPSSAEVLRALVQKRDDRVMAAFAVYLDDQNASEFSDSLVRIAAIASRSKQNTKQSEEEETKKMLAVVAALTEDGSLPSEDQEAVEALVKAREPRVLAALDVFAATSDAADLVDTLTRVVALERRAVTAHSPSMRMEKQLLHFVSELPLDAEQTAALKRAIAARDVEIEAAARTFLEQSDEVRLPL